MRVLAFIGCQWPVAGGQWPDCAEHPFTSSCAKAQDLKIRRPSPVASVVVAEILRRLRDAG
jgi:hypothetical protein